MQDLNSCLLLQRVFVGISRDQPKKTQVAHRRWQQQNIKSKTRHVIHRADSLNAWQRPALEAIDHRWCNSACQSPCRVPDDDVDDVAQNHYTSDSRVQKRAANQLDREHDVKPLPVFQPLLTPGRQTTTQKYGGHMNCMSTSETQEERLGIGFTAGETHRSTTVHHCCSGWF